MSEYTIYKCPLCQESYPAQAKHDCGVGFRIIEQIVKAEMRELPRPVTEFRVRELACEEINRMLKERQGAGSAKPLQGSDDAGSIPAPAANQATLDGLRSLALDYKAALEQVTAQRDRQQQLLIEVRNALTYRFPPEEIVKRVAEAVRDDQ